MSRLTTAFAQLADQINIHHNAVLTFARRSIEEARACGIALIAAKQAIETGDFSKWLVSNTAIDERRAWRYIRIAENWQTIEANPQFHGEMSIYGAELLITQSLQNPTLSANLRKEGEDVVNGQPPASSRIVPDLLSTQEDDEYDEDYEDEEEEEVEQAKSPTVNDPVPDEEPLWKIHQGAILKAKDDLGMALRSVMAIAQLPEGAFLQDDLQQMKNSYNYIHSWLNLMLPIGYEPPPVGTVTYGHLQARPDKWEHLRHNLPARYRTK